MILISLASTLFQAFLFFKNGWQNIHYGKFVWCIQSAKINIFNPNRRKVSVIKIGDVIPMWLTTGTSVKK